VVGRSRATPGVLPSAPLAPPAFGRNGSLSQTRKTSSLLAESFSFPGNRCPWRSIVITIDECPMYIERVLALPLRRSSATRRYGGHRILPASKFQQPLTPRWSDIQVAGSRALLGLAEARWLFGRSRVGEDCGLHESRLNQRRISTSSTQALDTAAMTAPMIPANTQYIPAASPESSSKDPTT
jgi:hypothetical protein